ncbi:MAG TPA: T9SS type A sorting domain-containing protein [Ignavibacteriaceae bacterium]|nr:T9SS type A sorting domain-containing protein [Ignavibacteriaceae bacterium]
MKTLYTIFFCTVFCSISIFSVPWDTGYIEWEQPDATKFTARSWGDEFASWMETDDGYQIILGPDEYYYYAILDESGEFTYSENKVIIDEPLPESYQLERSPQRLAEIEAEIGSFNEQLEQNYIDFMTEFDGPSARPLRLAVVLVDFADDLHNDDYVKSDFDTLFFSSGYYYTDPQANPVIYSPNGEWVYGSLRDYYRNQSINKFDIVGKFGSDRSIVNPPDPNNPNKPLWVFMPEEKSYYENLEPNLVKSLAYAQAESTLNIDLDQYDKVGFVYAGVPGQWGSGTWPTSGPRLFSSWERYGGTFAHIGVSAHEFAHTLGAADEYIFNDPTYGPRRWSVMAIGSYNGGDNGIGNNKGSCPAPLSPAVRIMLNWVSPVVTEPQENLIIQYNYSSPVFYKINIPASTQYFIVERRRKEGYDLYTPKYENPNDPPKGILIWHNEQDGYAQLEPANNIFPVGETGVRFPLNTIQDFTDLTSPSSNKRNGDYSFISLENIEWIDNQQPPYAKLDFSLEAIQITGSQTWSTDTNLSLPVFIKNGGTLNITNGANVNITGDYIEQIKFVIESGGSLFITGTEVNKSIIQSAQFNKEWKGIEVFNTGLINFNYSIVKDAVYLMTASTLDYAYFYLNNTELIGNTITLNGNIEIQNSIFKDASLLIYTSNNGSKLKKNIFSGQYYSDKFVQLVDPINSYLEVANCTFDRLEYGIRFGGLNVQFGDRTSQITVRNNIFSNCHKSIEVQYGQVSISYNNFYDNHYDENKGVNYLEEDPLYVDPDNNNFNLQWGSPCIDAGHPSSVYNDPDGTRNDMGAKYYDQSPLIPANFSVITGTGNHPFLEWDGAPHLSYKIYALYEYYNGNSSNNVYTSLTESYLDGTVIIVDPNGQIPNQVATYSVTSINSISEESEHTEEISIDVWGRIFKQALIDTSYLPVSYNLFNPYPNPFNPSTTIVFDLPEKSFVSIKLYSIIGEEVRTIVNEDMGTGRYHFLIDGNNLSSGVYLLRMMSNNFISSKKIILMK